MTANFEPSSLKPPQEADLLESTEESNEESLKPPQFEEMLSAESDFNSLKPPQ